MLGKIHQRGDTLIEVILAFTVFAMLAVGAIAVMNRGTLVAQQSLEVTLVKQQMDGQAEALRYLQASYVADPTASGPAATFDTIISAAKSSPSDLTDATCLTSLPAGHFAIDPEDAEQIPSYAMSNPNAPVRAQVFGPAGAKESYGLWIEAVEGVTDPGDPRFVDFHIRACWNGPMGSVPLTLGTIVRLYVPA